MLSSENIFSWTCEGKYIDVNRDTDGGYCAIDAHCIEELTAHGSIDGKKLRYKGWLKE